MSFRTAVCISCGYVGEIASVFYMDRGAGLRIDTRKKARIEQNRTQPKVFICDVCYEKRVA